MRTDDLPQQTAQDRRAVVQEAGLSRLSLVSVIAGTLTAYGSFALVAALAGGVLNAADVDTDFSTNDWSSTGAVGGLATGMVLLVAYLFGGYVAGRMARRSGLLHGLAVAILGIVGGGAIGALVTALADDADVERNLRSIGVPTSWDEWNAVAVATAIVAVAAIVVGAVAGALLGERWHARLVRRAADPEIGPAAEARRRADEQEAERDRLVERTAWPAGVSEQSQTATRQRGPDAKGDSLTDPDPDMERERDRDLVRKYASEPDAESDPDRVREPEPDRAAPRSEVIDLRDERTSTDTEVDDHGRRYTAAEWRAMDENTRAHKPRW